MFGYFSISIDILIQFNGSNGKLMNREVLYLHTVSGGEVFMDYVLLVQVLDTFKDLKSNLDQILGA